MSVLELESLVEVLRDVASVLVFAEWEATADEIADFAADIVAAGSGVPAKYVSVAKKDDIAAP
jgi:hypothetical protein